MDTQATADDGFALLDAGDGRRLERFGPVVVDRPAPMALEPRRSPAAWTRADLRFDAKEGWSSSHAPWEVGVLGLRLELRPTQSGGVGLYPEHLANMRWLETAVVARGGADPPGVLNLFAHTGLATLVAARAGAAVVHVDAARSAVTWARRNAAHSALADRPIRWLVDDAAAFVEREVRRGRRYDGVVLDPPSFGHAGARRWRLADELPRLLDACAALLAPEAFALLTAHTTGIDGSFLRDALGAAIPGKGGGSAGISVAALELRAESGARLPLGWTVRTSGRAG